MRKSTGAILGAVSVVVLSTGNAYSGNRVYPFGDEPYRLNWSYDPEIQSACWKWNWQQYHWDNHCPVYVHPKAYMYPRASGVVLRTKG